MSAKTSRSRVQSVSSTALSTVAAGGVVLAATLLTALARSLSSNARQAFKDSTRMPPADVNAIKPLHVLRAQHQLREREALKVVNSAGLSQLEAAKITTLASIAATPFMTASRPALQAHSQALCEAQTVEDVYRNRQLLLQELEGGHQQVFTEALKLACTQAAIQVGFDSIETMPGPLGTVRLIAGDPAGHALVTEIQVSAQGEPRIESEIVGITDGSCHEILDAFDQALEEAGVRASAPRRTSTGGVCELAATREFVRRKLKPRTRQPEAQPASQQDERTSRRRQQLNLKNINKQK